MQALCAAALLPRRYVGDGRRVAALALGRPTLRSCTASSACCATETRRCTLTTLDVAARDSEAPRHRRQRRRRRRWRRRLQRRASCPLASTAWASGSGGGGRRCHRISERKRKLSCVAAYIPARIFCRARAPTGPSARRALGALSRHGVTALSAGALRARNGARSLARCAALRRAGVGGQAGIRHDMWRLTSWRRGVEFKVRRLPSSSASLFGFCFSLDRTDGRSAS